MHNPTAFVFIAGFQRQREREERSHAVEASVGATNGPITRCSPKTSCSLEGRNFRETAINKRRQRVGSKTNR